MSGDDVVYLTVGLGWMCATAVAMEWWHRARTIWLSRLSARGRLTGTYTPAPANTLGRESFKWLLRQRVTVSDLWSIASLEGEVDEDRVTEVWRIRTARRFKIVLALGFGGLAMLGLSLTLYEIYGWTVFGAIVALLVGVAVFRGRSVYLRVREWGDYGVPT